MNEEWQHRIVELESKVAFQDDTIEQLNGEINEHQTSILKLQEQIALLGNRFKEIREEMDSEQPQSIVHELPPHY